MLLLADGDKLVAEYMERTNGPMNHVAPLLRLG